MPSQCSRCDDKCSKRDGMKDRHGYKPAIPDGNKLDKNFSIFTKRPPDKPHKGRFYEETDDGYCTYSCKKWPYRNCWVSYKLNAQFYFYMGIGFHLHFGYNSDEA